MTLLNVLRIKMSLHMHNNQNTLIKFNDITKDCTILSTVLIAQYTKVSTILFDYIPIED